jgi:hypothetical protein
MSKVKSPQEKKELSLRKDRRNLYGECPTSSRKNISRGKKRSHRELRRAASQVLLSLKGDTAQLEVDDAESQAKSKIISLKRSAFRKRPDVPLSAAIKRRVDWRTKRQQRGRTIPNA